MSILKQTKSPIVRTKIRLMTKHDIILMFKRFLIFLKKFLAILKEIAIFIVKWTIRGARFLFEELQKPKNWVIFFKWCRQMAYYIVMDFINFVIFIGKEIYQNVNLIFFYLLEKAKNWKLWISWKLCIIMACLGVVLYFDNKANKKLKYQKRLAPNLLWRVVGVAVYYPPVVEFMYAYFQVIFRYTPLIRRIFGYEYRKWLINAFISMMRLEDTLLRRHYGILAFFELVMYFSIQWIVAFIPPSIIRLPIYLRYHMVNCSLLMLLSPTVYQAYRFILKVDKEVMLNHADLPGLFYLGTEREYRVAAALTCIFLSTYGRSIIDAIRGRSFTRTFLRKAVRTHLGISKLYPDETWEQFGLDDRLRKDGIDNEL